MTRRPLEIPVLACALLLLVSVPPAGAQVYESIGIRAQGMAGAFTAVSDDATTTWWNPAGLNSGALFGAVVEHRSPIGDDGETTWGVSVTVLSLGLSYYHLRVPSALPPSSTAPLTGDRQDQRAAGARVSASVLNQFGATVGVSLGDHLVLGSTPQLVSADQTKGDVDLGALATFGNARVAVVVKRLIAPDLTSEGRPIASGRQVRIGAAYAGHVHGQVRLTGAVDADLTITSTADGDERHLAGGIEAWVSRFLSIRGGVGVNTVGAVRPSVAGGASVAIRSGFFIDGHVAGGQDEVTKGWGLAARVTF